MAELPLTHSYFLSEDPEELQITQARAYQSFPIGFCHGVNPLHQAAQTQTGEPMTTMAVSPSDVFNTWAQAYDEQPNPLIALERRFLSRMLPDVSGLDVLDVGCGTGRWLQFLVPHHTASLVGVDASPEMLQRASAKLRYLQRPPRQGSCVAGCPSSNPLADLILASFVLSYLDECGCLRPRTLSGSQRPGATIFLSDMHPDTATSCNWKRSFKANGTEDYLRTKSHSPQQVTDAFRSCGFDLLTRIEPAFDSPREGNV